MLMFEVPDALVFMLRYIAVVVLLVGVITSLLLRRTGHAVASLALAFFILTLLFADNFGQGVRVALFYIASITFGGVPTWHYWHR